MRQAADQRGISTPMSEVPVIRVLFTGNCQAQYLASAFGALTGHEVRFVGKLHTGPTFQGRGAVWAPFDEGLEWLQEVGPERRLIVYQTTPYQKPLPSAANETPTVLYPCVKFDAPYWIQSTAGTSTRRPMAPGMAISLQRRGDRMFNESSCFLAGIGTENLAQIEYRVRTQPILLANGHFAGSGMAWFVGMMIKNGLGAHVGHANADAYLKGVAADHGIGFKIVPMVDDLHPSHEISWWPPQAGARLAELLRTDAAALAKNLRAGLSEILSEHDAHTVWAAAFDRYVVTGDLFALKIMISLYRPRRYLPWARVLSKVLIKRLRLSAASILVRHRLPLTDGRDQFVELEQKILELRMASGPHRAMASCAVAGLIRQTAREYAEASPADV